MRPNKDILDAQKAQGFSFIYAVDPEFQAQYAERTGADGSVSYRHIASTGSLSQVEIIAKHAPRVGVQPDRLRVVMGAYRDKQFHPDVAKQLQRMAAVFVKTDDLEGFLERNPVYRLLQ